jgi:hypothetical protein
MKVRLVPRARKCPQLPRPTTSLAREKFDAGKKQSSHDASSHYKKGRQAEHVTRPLHPLEDQQVKERAQGGPGKPGQEQRARKTKKKAKRPLGLRYELWSANDW